MKRYEAGLRIVTAACLVVSGLIHLHLAKYYPAGKVIHQSIAFRIQGVVVFVLAAAVLVVPRKRLLIWWAVFVVAAGSVAALLISRYWMHADDLPALLPEPSWQIGDSYLGLREKQLALIVEGIAFLTSLAAIVPMYRAGRRP